MQGDDIELGQIAGDEFLKGVIIEVDILRPGFGGQLAGIADMAG